MLDLMPRAAAALASPARGDAAGMLEAVLADRDTAAARAVARLGLDARALVAAVGAAERPLEQDLWASHAEWRRRAEDEARRRGHGYIGTEHLLLGLLHTEPVAGPVRLAGHSGTFPGFDAAAYACPETARSAALLANTNMGLLKDQIRKALGPGRPVRSPPT